MPVSHCENDGLPALPLFSAADKHATQFPGKAAVIDVKARRAFTYRDLLAGTARVKNLIIKALEVNNADIQEQRVAYLVPSGIDYVQIQWGIWAAGGVAVPLCTTHPFQELEYTVSNSKPTLIFLHQDFSQHKSAFLTIFPSIKVLDVPLSHDATEYPSLSVPTTSFYSAFSLSRRALIIYTSGTTSRPKGCVTTHANIDFQANSLVKAWKYTSSDYLVHVLPLHHVHGIINGLTATLLAGGTVELHPKFDPVVVWKRWMDGDSTMFMAVPTVYSRLNTYFLEHISGTDDEKRVYDSTRKLRLTVSGSAALPTSVKHRFEKITGQVLLERYGMTEIGMGLSCRYDNSDGCGRPDGSVGWPLEGVEVRLVQDSGRIIPLASQSTEAMGTSNDGTLGSRTRRSIDDDYTNTLGSQAARSNNDDNTNDPESITPGAARSENDGASLNELQGIGVPAGDGIMQADSRSLTVERDSRLRIIEKNIGTKLQDDGQHSEKQRDRADLIPRGMGVLGGIIDTGASIMALESKELTGTSSLEVSALTFIPEPPLGQSNNKTLEGGSSSSGSQRASHLRAPAEMHNPAKFVREPNDEDPTVEKFADTSMDAQSTSISIGAYVAGEIQIRGPNVFKEYWENPTATAKEFTNDGYFKTGDVAYRDQDGAYYIQGRSSVDIIKSGGYKISALDVEREILSTIRNVKEAAVVGVPDEEWGERVAAVVTMEHGVEGMDLKEFRNMLRNVLTPYKIPSLLKVVKEIERNAMGKVNKKKLTRDIWPQGASSR
ncbi:hypothetical protein TWF730_009121 [Orbilia blumenaviensis]|uniref:Uncharacterized protein n=1 Tax=Orbilia blumenaviensis TaxID=1796055 RepID=A0AAV9V3Z3_9PEZI